MKNNIPVVMVGKGTRFRKAMRHVSSLMPKLWSRVDELDLQRSYEGLQKIRFVERLERGNKPFHYDPDEDVISIYPLSNGLFGRIDKAFYSALGARFYANNVSGERRLQWSRKLVLPKRATIDKVQRMLKKGEFKNFRKLISSFKTPNDRLIALHICNALIKNSVRPSVAKELDLKRFPATKDFCRAHKPYSLRPLLSVYGAKNMTYEQAFGEYCARKGTLGVSDQSVANGFLEVFRSVTFDG